MPIPIIVIASALSAGGSLVPHAAGGLIVTSTGGYVTGTYLSTAAISSLVLGGTGLLSAGAVAITGLAASAIGSAGIFGTTIGATGITGALMSAGLISSTPIWVPAAVASAAGALGYGGLKLYQLHRKLKATPEGEEAQFTEVEAKFIERLLLKASKPQGT